MDNRSVKSKRAYLLRSLLSTGYSIVTESRLSVRLTNTNNRNQAKIIVTPERVNLYINNKQVLSL